MSVKKSDEEYKVNLEEALDIAGFGVYSYYHVVLTGLTILGFACHAYSNAVIIPTSACELATTSGQQGLLGAAPIAGMLVGAIPLSYLADRRGRKNMLILSILITICLNMIRAISVNWIMLLIMELSVNFVGAGQYMLSMTLLSECVPLAKRNLAVLLVTSIFLPAQGILAVMASPIIPLSFSYYLPALGIYWNSWRTLQVVYSVPSMIAVIGLCFTTESPKFVFNSGDDEGALEILKTLHRRNHLKSKVEYPVTRLIKDVQKSDKPMSGKEQVMPLFRPPLLKYLLIMTTLLVLEQVGALQIWFPTLANQFMQMVETGAPMNQTLCDVLRSRPDASVDSNAAPCSLNNTAMLIILASGALQSVANLLISALVHTLGRRNIVIGLTAICGLSGIVVNLISNTVASAAFFIIYMLGYTVIGVYMAIGVALFPTQVRAMAVAMAVSGGRVANVIAIQLLNIVIESNCDASFYALGVICISSAVVASLLPDDRKIAKHALENKTSNDYDTRL